MVDFRFEELSLVPSNPRPSLSITFSYLTLRKLLKYYNEHTTTYSAERTPDAGEERAYLATKIIPSWLEL